MAAVVQSDSSSFDMWRKIPPEEKLELMAKAQSKGIAAATILLTVSGTIALGLKLPWLFWSAFVGIPFIFQFASAKAWRDLKPRAMLEYLAARSAARRYAYQAGGKDLTITLLFKGTLQPDFSEEEEEEAIEARISHRDRVDVWIALFPDTVVMISERQGGAKLEFAQILGERLEVVAEGFDEAGGKRLIRLIVDNRKGDRHGWVLTSPFPAALLVFERKIKAFMVEQKAQIERDRLAHTELFAQKLADEESGSDSEF